MIDRDTERRAIIEWRTIVEEISSRYSKSLGVLCIKKCTPQYGQKYEIDNLESLIKDYAREVVDRRHGKKWEQWCETVGLVVIQTASIEEIRE